MVYHPGMEAMAREEWLRERRKGIGGSDAATLFGANPWASKFSLFQDKVGALPIETREESANMRWGNILEPVVRDQYAIETSRTVTDGATGAVHPELEIARANTDGTIAEIEGFSGPGVYEGKISFAFSKRAEWAEGVPLYYQIQVQHYMAVLDYKWASVAAFLPGKSDPLVFFDIERNDRFVEALLEEEDSFWRKHVVPKVAPDPDGSRSSTKALKLLHPKDNGLIVRLPQEGEELAEELAKVKAEIKELDARKKACENKIKAMIGDHTFGVLSDGTGFSFKHQHKKSYTVKAQDIRVLNAIKKVKV